MLLTNDQLHTALQPGTGSRPRRARFRRMALGACFLILVATLGLSLAKNAIHNVLRDKIAGNINERLAGSPFHCRLGDARWSEGRGLGVYDLIITDIRTGEPVFTCGRVFAESKFQLVDVLSSGPSVESLLFEEARIYCRGGNGRPWNVNQLFQALNREDAEVFDFPVRVRDSSVTFDADSLPLGKAVTIRGINFDHIHDLVDRQKHQVNGHLSLDLAGRLDFEIEADGQRDIWTSKLFAKRIELNHQWANLLTQLVGENQVLQSLGGQIALTAGATGRLSQTEMPVFEIVGRAVNVQCLDTSLPHQIHDGSFEFRVDNKQDYIPRVNITKAQFGVGYGTAAGNLLIVDPLGQLTWRLTGNVRQFQLTERLLPWMTHNVCRAWHQFQPQGTIDSDFDLQFSQGKLHREIHTSVRDGSMSWDRFPFRISSCNGIIDWIGSTMTMDLAAIEAQQLVTIKAEFENPGDDWTGWVQGDCEGLIPINEKMLQAFDVKPELARTLRKFNTTGYVTGWGRIERHAGSPIANTHFNINLRQATIRHDSFDYPIYNVNGLILVDNDETQFQQLRGMNNNGVVECNGIWERGRGLDLRFLASNVLLNDELKYALPRELQKTWHGLRPTGTIDLVDVDWNYATGASKPVVGVTVKIPQNASRISSVAINPVWFPYEMRHVTGEFRFEDQRIDIREFAARHGRTTINSHGSGAFDDDQWRIRLTGLFANKIVLDDELRAALPESIAMGLDRIKFKGHLSMQGAVDISGDFDDSTVGQHSQSYRPRASNGRTYVSTSASGQSDFDLGWQLDFGIGQARATIGIPITNATGVVRVGGNYTNGKVNCEGTILIDSMIYRDIQITSVVAPLSINNFMIGIGSLPATADPQSPSPPATARLFGGVVECDAWISFLDDHEYFFQAKLADGDLNAFAFETAMKQQEFSGQAFASVRMKGDSTGTHSVIGDGFIQLRNAKIYEVPVMIALLNVLRIREPDRTAFDQGQMEFTIRGENIDFQRIEFNGDALSLIGRGTLNLDSEIELHFYTMMGRNRWFVPVLTQLYHAGSQQLWWVRVDGTLEEPITDHQILPGLNDSLKQLFPELAEDG